MKTLYLLVGPPCSGKSTWTAAHMADAARPTTIASTDDIIEERAAELGMTYSEAFKALDFKEIEKEMWARFKAALERGDDIIVDRTNMKVKSRASFLAQTPRKTYRTVAVVFEVPREELDRRLKARAEATGKNIPKFVVDGMIESYQEPQVGEVNEIITVKYEVEPA